MGRNSKAKLKEFKSPPPRQSCILCRRKATWIRYTQFSGTHPFCSEHAKQESDFGEDDSYKFWVEQK